MAIDRFDDLTPAPLTRLDRHPVSVYLASLSQTGRRTMESKLHRAAGLLGYSEAFAAPWESLRFQHVAALRTRLQEEGLAPATINATLCAVRGVALAAFNLGLMGGDDLERIRSVKPVRSETVPSGRSLASGEIRNLLEACVAGGRIGGHRDAAIIAMLYTGGLRRAEIVGLNLSDYDPDTGRLVVRGKGNKERILWVNEGAKPLLQRWLSRRGDGPGPLFVPVDRWGNSQIGSITAQAVYAMLRKRAKQASVKEFSPHDLRRTFVSDLLDAGADVVTVQKLAGHANVQTTARYDRRGEETQKNAISLLEIPEVLHQNG